LPPPDFRAVLAERQRRRSIRRRSIRSRDKAADSYQTARDSLTSLGMTRRRRARLFFKQQLAGAVRGFNNGLNERDAKLSFFEFKDAVDGAAGWSSHCIFEERGMIAGLQHNARRALHSLRCEKSSYIARQTNLHTAFGERFQNYVYERGPTR